MSDPSAELEQCAAELRQRAWLLSEFWQALRDLHIPEPVAHDLLIDYRRDELLVFDPVTDD